MNPVTTEPINSRFCVGGARRRFGAKAVLLVVLAFACAVCARRDPGNPTGEARRAQASESAYQAMWVSIYGPGMLSASETESMIATARQNHVNAIFPNIRNHGDAYYISTLEPRAAGLAATYEDPLADILARAHDTTGGRQRIEVHGWIIPYQVWSQAAGDPPEGHILRRHPEWLTRDDKGNLSTEVLDPGVPEVSDYLVEVVLEIVNRYDIDGIHFDYVRYFGNEWGYNPVSVARFNALHGRAGMPPRDDPAWSEFRREQIRAMVRRVYARVKEARWTCKVSAATITWLPAPPDGDFTQTRAYAETLQDWPSMMAEGSLDLNCPMNYMREHVEAQKAGFRAWTRFAAETRAGRHVAIGLGSYLSTRTNNPVQIGFARRTEGIAGTVIYRYGMASSEADEDGAWRAIRDGAYDRRREIPVADWLANPTTGILRGTVRDRNGLPVDGAVVTVSGGAADSVRADGSGCFAFLRQPPGDDSHVAAEWNGVEESSTFTIVKGRVTMVDLTLDFDAGAARFAPSPNTPPAVQTTPP